MYKCWYGTVLEQGAEGSEYSSAVVSMGPVGEWGK